MLSADDYAFEYPTADELALDEVSFSVGEGDVLGVVGPVEAGKTTLAMSVAGFVPGVTGGWSGGDLTVAGRDPREADDNRVAMVFEDYSSQLTQLRVIDEVVAPLVNRGVPREEALPRARDLLDRVRLDEPEDKFTWELSGGQQQRLAIAAALAIDPEVFVFDTATDMLDPEGRAEVYGLMGSLAGDHTLVVTENDPDALVGLADDLLVLDDGEVAAFGDADELLRDAALLERVGVAPPVALRAADRLGLDGRPTDPSEFRACYLSHLGEAAAPDAPGAPSDGADRNPVETAAADGGGAPTLGRDPADEPLDRFGDPVVEAEGVGFEYPDGTRALSGVDLTVREGEVHAVVGGNGAGKSTLTKLLVGLLDPTEGTVAVGGTDTRTATARDLGETIGLALQNPDMQVSRETVDGEIRYPLEQRRHERRGPLGLLGKRERYGDAHVEERAAAVRELVGIPDEMREKDPAFLPRGEQRQVTMAAALAPDPDALVVDEPTAGVDAAGADALARAVEELRDAGTAVVLVEHDVDFLCEVADRVTVLEDGRVAVQGPVEAVFDRENWAWLSERYLRPPRPARVGHRVGATALTLDGLVADLEAPPEVAQ